MEFNKMSISNLIYDKIKFDKVCKNDLDFALDIFIQNQEYEKCSVVKELLELRYYDNRKKSNNEAVLNVHKIIELIQNKNFVMEEKDVLKYRKKIKQLKDDISSFYDMMNDKESKIIIPPFKNKNNIKYFLTI